MVRNMCVSVCCIMECGWQTALSVAIDVLLIEGATTPHAPFDFLAVTV